MHKSRILLFLVALLASESCSAWAFSPLIGPVPQTRSRTSEKRNLPVFQPSLAARSTLLAASNNNNNSNNNDNQKEGSGWISLSDRTKGLAVLLTVPLAWGTYVPVVRYLYEIQPAVPGFVFSACYYAVASLTTLSIVATQETRNEKEEASSETTSSSFPILGGMELGTYLFLGNCFQVIGLKTVPADRAGFLVQLTTVMVPIAEALFAGNLLAVSARTWFSCLLAFTGICVMNLDGLTQGSMASVLAAFQSFTQGDLLILSAAILYTLHVVRLGRYARETTPIKLAASKATVETILSTGLVVALMSVAGSGAAASTGLMSFVQESGAEITSFFSTITKSIAAGAVPQSAVISAVGATLWTGLVTCAYTIFAQSYGQKRVGPTDANLIYSIQPICTALFAFVLLGETMGPAGVVGGAFIGAAVYLVTAVGGDSGDSKGDDEDVEELIVDVTLETERERQRNTTEVPIKR